MENKTGKRSKQNHTRCTFEAIAKIEKILVKANTRFAFAHCFLWGMRRRCYRLLDIKLNGRHISKVLLLVYVISFFELAQFDFFKGKYMLNVWQTGNRLLVTSFNVQNVIAVCCKSMPYVIIRCSIFVADGKYFHKRQRMRWKKR